MCIDAGVHTGSAKTEEKRGKTGSISSGHEEHLPGWVRFSKVRESGMDMSPGFPPHPVDYQQRICLVPDPKVVLYPAYLTRPLCNRRKRMIIKTEARLRSNTVCLPGRYFIPGASVASLHTRVDETRPCVSPFGCTGILIRCRRQSLEP